MNAPATCAQCGAALSAPGVACPACGAAPRVVGRPPRAVGRPPRNAPLPAPIAAEPPSRKAKSRLLPLIMLGGGLLAVIGGVGLYLSSGRTEPPKPSITEAPKPPEVPPEPSPPMPPMPPTEVTPVPPKVDTPPTPKPPKPPPKTTPPKPPPATTETKRGAEWARELDLVPVSAAQTIAFDGVELPVAATMDRLWTFLPPKGEHSLKIERSDRRPTPRKTFREVYADSVGRFQVDGKWSRGKLLEAARVDGGALTDPLVAHCWGNLYWEEKQPAAAIRCWRRAVQMEPAFSPAHVNLAFAYAEDKNATVARREVALAHAFNTHDAFGVADHILALRERLGFGPSLKEPVVWPEDDYEPARESLTERERRVTGFYRSLAEHSTRASAKAKAYNNGGVFAVEVAKKPQWGLWFFQEAQTALARGGEDVTRGELPKHLLGRLEAAARAAKYPEAEMYAKLQEFFP